MIDRYVAIANPHALGLGLNVHLDQPQQSKSALAAFESRIAEHDEVMECYLMTGDSDYLIRVVVADIQALEKFILEQLSPIPASKNPIKLHAEAGALQDGAAGAGGVTVCTRLQLFQLTRIAIGLKLINVLKSIFAENRL